ncbi:hypothetical protein [Agathobaculum desmolans]|uniref:hypothetical protein n=1 Tax=Agathobaculum desmolans TaxID=39484 RepID=UPI0004E1F79E|nr:hypothetical protein [Agathobaculum desmolans]
MAWVTEEEYQAAKQVRAYEYLQTYQLGRLKKTRTRKLKRENETLRKENEAMRKALNKRDLNLIKNF